jgi:hypothetical protein
MIAKDKTFKQANNNFTTLKRTNVSLALATESTLVKFLTQSNKFKADKNNNIKLG